VIVDTLSDYKVSFKAARDATRLLTIRKEVGTMGKSQVEVRGNWDVPTAAARIGVAPVTLRRWLRLGRLGFFRAGRRVVIAPEDVEAFLRANRVEPRYDAHRSA
jgi:excisionase family DNA binding protein